MISRSRDASYTRHLQVQVLQELSEQGWLRYLCEAIHVHRLQLHELFPFEEQE